MGNFGVLVSSQLDRTSDCSLGRFHPLVINFGIFPPSPSSLPSPSFSLLLCQLPGLNPGNLTLPLPFTLPPPLTTLSFIHTHSCSTPCNLSMLRASSDDCQFAGRPALLRTALVRQLARTLALPLRLRSLATSIIRLPIFCMSISYNGFSNPI